MYGIAGLLTGRTLAGRYLIEAVIGRGGMGAVYRALDERLARPVAVKVIGTSTTDPAEHGRLRARFHREARAAAALHHPNVVAVHDFGTDGELGLDFLVMELLRGEDLQVRLARDGKLPAHTALSVLRQASRGLAAGHRAGMVHRDVKPGNLFLEVGDHPDEPHVRVMDFGIALVEADELTLTHLTEYGRSPFSPAYASPEQLRGEEGVTPASDVFSLAAVGVHMLTGERSFTSSDPTRAALEVGDAVRRLRERAPTLDTRTHAALVRALAQRPADRFRDAGLFADALGAAAERPAPAAAAVPAQHTRFVADDYGEDDHTQLYTPPPAQRTVQPAQPRPAAPAPQSQPAVPARTAPPVQMPHPMFTPQAMAAAHAVLQAPAQDRRPGAMRRFFRALWEFSVTTAALVLFAGAWAVAIQGVLDEDRRAVLAGGAASVLLTPWAIHRLTGRRGRIGFGVGASILATGVAVKYVGTEGDPLILLGSVFGLQVLSCFFMSWLTRRKEQQRPYA
jgi:serine/threonine protein kinase